MKTAALYMILGMYLILETNKQIDYASPFVQWFGSVILLVGIYIAVESGLKKERGQIDKEG